MGPNEITRFGGMIFFLVIFNELINKCVVKFGKLVRILKVQWKC